MKPIAVITGKRSDLYDLLKASEPGIACIKPGELEKFNLNDFSAFLLLGGTEEEPLILHAGERKLIEEQYQKGKRIFCEFVGSISWLYHDGMYSTRFERLVCCKEGIPGLASGDILEDQCNTALKFWSAPKECRPILVYNGKAMGHDTVVVDDEVLKDSNKYALFFCTENLLVCSFRMCNYNAARFAPLERWRALVEYVLGWVCGTDMTVAVESLASAYHTRRYKEAGSFEQQLEQCIDKAIRWFDDAGVLLMEGKLGVLEGMGTEVYPDGTQKIAKNVRTDNTSEASLAFYMHYCWKQDERSLQVSNNLTCTSFDGFQINDGGPFDGMLRWSEQAWGVCYADDAGRALIPILIKMLYSGSRERIDDCVRALHFLVKTTGIDGIRAIRTDNEKLTDEKITSLACTSVDYPCAHYNAYYHAALLLAYKLTGIREFADTAARGLSTIMSFYPDTKREISETEELCRLVMPLAWLYWVTGDETHRSWLYRVTNDLQRFRHSSGAYTEWDTGYIASLSRNVGGESSLLANNGDPVVDMLYSINWLPMGFSQAYLVTGDDMFFELWKDIARFMISAQIHSCNPLINGGWARGFDVERMEVFGLPNDVGWGPWCVTSGWTVSEIASGLIIGLNAEKLKQHYM